MEPLRHLGLVAERLLGRGVVRLVGAEQQPAVREARPAEVGSPAGAPRPPAVGRRAGARRSHRPRARPHRQGAAQEPSTGSPPRATRRERDVVRVGEDARWRSSPSSSKPQSVSIATQALATPCRAHSRVHDVADLAALRAPRSMLHAAAGDVGARRRVHGGEVGPVLLAPLARRVADPLLGRPRACRGAACPGSSGRRLSSSHTAATPAASLESQRAQRRRRLR